MIYGYLWDEKREHWLVDEKAAAVVRRIFAMTLAGYGPYQIATQLTKDKVEIPSVHLARFNEGVNHTKPVKDIYGWGSSTIAPTTASVPRSTLAPSTAKSPLERSAPLSTASRKKQSSAATTRGRNRRKSLSL